MEIYRSIVTSIDKSLTDATRNSHVFEALSLGLHDQKLRGMILKALHAYVFGDDEYVSEKSITVGIKSGDWLKDVVDSARETR